MARHCGTLDGVDVYLINDGARAVVRRSTSTLDQCTSIFSGAKASTSDLESIAKVQWSDGDAAATAKAWVAEECSTLSGKLNAVVESLRVTTEGSPS
jgi:hypothetical protein